MFFSDISLLDLAFTHKSYINENSNYKQYNERLEFLGDSVLSLITIEFLFFSYPGSDEGKLSKIKSMLVSESVLSEIARDLHLSRFLLLGKGEKITGGTVRPSNLANLLEALLGAMYLDQGLGTVKNWFSPFLKKYIHKIEKLREIKDSKTELQEFSQKKFKIIPIYELLEEKGPDHNKMFTVEVEVKGKKAKGSGSTKRSAEAEAAMRLLKILKSNRSIE